MARAWYVYASRTISFRDHPLELLFSLVAEKNGRCRKRVDSNGLADVSPNKVIAGGRLKILFLYQTFFFHCRLPNVVRGSGIRVVQQTESPGDREAACRRDENGQRKFESSRQF